jgi:hypothetical protein
MSQCRYTAGIACVSLVLVLVGCERKLSPVITSCPTGTVTLAIDTSTTANNECMQNGVENGNIVVSRSSGITWVAPTSTTQLSIQLNSPCGFAQCSFSGTGSVSSGASNSTAGTVVGYSANGITIGSTQCKVMGDGLVMR